MVDGDGIVGEGVVLMVFDIIAIQKGKGYHWWWSLFQKRISVPNFIT